MLFPEEIQKDATRWAIVGCGRIASEFVNALRLGDLARERHVVTVVASREVNKAEDFIATHFNLDAAKACTYEECYANKAIDIIYVSTINKCHKDLVLAALESGHNVLCEKCQGVTAAEVKEMNALAKKRGLFLMEGYWSAFFMAQQDVKRRLDGMQPLMSLQASFCKPSISNLTERGGGGGVFYNCGYYVVALAVFLTERVVGARIEDIETAAVKTDDKCVDRTLQFGFTLNGMRVHGVTSLDLASRNEALIMGKNGAALRMPTWFHVPLRVEGFKPHHAIEYSFEGQVDPIFRFQNSAGFIFEADHVHECLKAGLTESNVWSHAHAELAAEIMQRIRLDAGIEFPQERSL